MGAVNALRCECGRDKFINNLLQPGITEFHGDQETRRKPVCQLMNTTLGSPLKVLGGELRVLGPLSSRDLCSSWVSCRDPFRSPEAGAGARCHLLTVYLLIF